MYYYIRYVFTIQSSSNGIWFANGSRGLCINHSTEYILCCHALTVGYVDAYPQCTIQSSNVIMVCTNSACGLCINLWIYGVTIYMNHGMYCCIPYEYTIQSCNSSMVCTDTALLASALIMGYIELPYT